MNGIKTGILTVLAAILLFQGTLTAQSATSAGELLQEGLFQEEVEGNLDAAIAIYAKIAEDVQAKESYLAQAYYRLGMCHLKKQNDQQARVAFTTLMEKYPGQTHLIEKVKPLLNDMVNPDPAALMPADTMIYGEMGSPGHQVETIVNMLKGTPLENPLAMINANTRQPNQNNGSVTSAGMIGALFNPSMMTEFKKIRGFAVGASGDITRGNPNIVAVFYPGKSDALRGLIMAGLGMAGVPGNPVEGMATINIQQAPISEVGCAYDNEVIIIARPRTQLEWCVKQYKGVSNEPTLVSQNKVFARISRKNREENLVTYWVNGQTAYKAIAEQMNRDKGTRQQFQAVEQFVDPTSIDSILSYINLRKDGLTLHGSIDFQKDQACLPYGMIRTPNLTCDGFEAVPSEAVALISIALGNGNNNLAGDKLTKLTGLDIGRELFANIQQINLFAMPQFMELPEAELSAMSCMGLAITSNNPAKTKQLLSQALTILELFAAMDQFGQLPQKDVNHPNRYGFQTSRSKPAFYFYLGQAGKSTILTFNPAILNSALGAVNNRQCALNSGPLSEPLSQLPASTSKLALVNAAGGLKIANGIMNIDARHFRNGRANPMASVIAQLAQECPQTSLMLRTVERDDQFNINVSLDKLPPLGKLSPIIMPMMGMQQHGAAGPYQPKIYDIDGSFKKQRIMVISPGYGWYTYTKDEPYDRTNQHKNMGHVGYDYVKNQPGLLLFNGTTIRQVEGPALPSADTFSDYTVHIITKDSTYILKTPNGDKCQLKILDATPEYVHVEYLKIN
ncbi:MAG: tetratricopeptide repeat protein [Pseudomonadales bacterium]|nr:tetratricopeptide repeat protein [Pseudomonadales bacterium]